MENLLLNLKAILKQFALIEGKNATQIPYLSLYAYSQSEIALPDTQNPYILLVVSGTMRLHRLEGARDYAPAEIFIPTLKSPLSAQVLESSADNPFLAISVNFSLEDIIGVMLEIEGDLPERLFAADYQCELQSENRLLEILSRLLVLSAEELSFMCKHLRREILFYLIVGAYGREFLQGILTIAGVGEIYAINSWIKRNYKETFTIEELARQGKMSPSSFHQKFKSAVGMGAIQCQKKLRLKEARRLMLDEGFNVTDAAFEVGYESLSQFIRDYGRAFGRSPQKDIQVLMDCFKNQF